MAQKHRLLIVDDEESITYLLKTEFDERREFETETVLSGADALNILQQKSYDIVLLDVKMPRVSGIEVLKFIREQSPTTQVIMLTNTTDVQLAVETTKLGAFGFISKPYDFEQLMTAVRRAVEHRQLLIQKEVQQIGRTTSLVGESEVFKEAVQKAIKLASSDAFVLISGSSGTGKELFAELIHNSSQRKDAPFIAVNCAAMPDQLLETELFGHERGAFTSAVRTKEGLVEVANGGTLFLDEVGDISPLTQPKLLRFLETGEFRRVGGIASRRVDVRVVSATNKNLQQEVKSGRFREDLLYRLNVVGLHLPLLKDRKEDIPALVNYFLSRKSKSKMISGSALQVLAGYAWPGNVRELEHVIEGAVALSHSDLIEPKDLWMNVALSSSLPLSNVSASAQADHGLIRLDQLERIHIERVLQSLHWNRTKAAKTLGITSKTLYLKIKRYKIKIPRNDEE
jgi:DNA-binding NtrC family response regulator